MMSSVVGEDSCPASWYRTIELENIMTPGGGGGGRLTVVIADDDDEEDTVDGVETT
jgi:hypothetical protein